ncbi:MAG: O-antigen polymerase [Metamycoplasmataceae bacterium]
MKFKKYFKKIDWQFILPIFLISLFVLFYQQIFWKDVFKVNSNSIENFNLLNNQFIYIKIIYFILIPTTIFSSFFLLGKELNDKENTDNYFKNFFLFMLFISLSIFILIGMFIPFTLKFIDQNFKNIFKNLDIILNFEINNLNYFLILISSMFFIYLCFQNKNYLFIILFLIYISFNILFDFTFQKFIHISMNEMILKNISKTLSLSIFLISILLTYLIKLKVNKTKIIHKKITFYFLKKDFKKIIFNLIIFSLQIIAYYVFLKNMFNNKLSSILENNYLNFIVLFSPLIFWISKETGKKHFNSLKNNFYNFLFIFIFLLSISIGIYFIKKENIDINIYFIYLLSFVIFIINIAVNTFILSSGIVHILIIQKLFIFIASIILYLLTINISFNFNENILIIILHNAILLYSLMSIITIFIYLKTHKIKVFKGKNFIRFFVVGNINSGKSLYVQKLKELTNFEVISIDNIREKYGSFTKDKEKLVFKQLLKQILKTKNCIVEFSGLEENLNLILNKIDPLSTYVFYVNTPKEKCLETLIPEKYEEIPYFNFSEKNLIDGINDYAKKEESNQINNIWFGYSNLIFNISSINDFENIPLNKIIAFDYIKNKLEDIYLDSAFLTGSLVNGNFNRYSDINIAVISPINALSLRNLLTNDSKIDSILKRKNVVSLIIDDTLFDLAIFSKLEDAHKIIYQSKIKEFNKVPLINAPSIKKIKYLSKKEIVDEIELYLDLIGETDYLSSNLSRIAARGDKYKFYLTTLKLVQNIVRLNALIDGNDYNFLPEQAIKYINNPKIVYTLNLSMTRYIEDFEAYWKDNKGKYYIHLQEALKRRLK